MTNYIDDHFDDLFEQRLLTILRPLEAKRKKYRTAILIFGAISLLAFIIAFVGAIHYQGRSIPPSIFVGIIMVAIAIIGISQMHSRFQNNISMPFQNLVVPDLLTLIPHPLSYFPYRCIESRVCHESRLFTYFNDYEGDNLIEGGVREAPIRFCQIRTYQNTPHNVVNSSNTEDNVASSHYRRVFSGFFFEAQLTNPFPSWVEIRNRRKEPNKAHPFYEPYFGTTRQVPFDDMEFENLFDVYSKDEESARSLLTPSLRSRMVTLCKLFDRKTEFCFRNHSIYVTVAWPNSLFDLSIFQPLGQKHYLKEFVQTLNNLLSIVDHLQLSQETT